MSKEEMRDRFEARWGQTNDEQGLYFIPELNTYGCELAKNQGMADRKSSAWYYFQLGQESALVATPKADAQPVAWIKPDVLATLRKDDCCYAFGEQLPKGNLIPLFTRSDAGEVESLRIDLELTRLARQGDQIEIDGLKALCDGLRAQLADAAQSLETISRLAGRDELMEDMTDVRGYANSRASVARGALSASAEPASKEIAQ